MKAQQHELDLLHHEGYRYQREARRGWCFGDEWVGYNVQDAFAHRAKREGGELDDSNQRQLPGKVEPGD